MADMLNSILNTIREITASEGFQKFLNGVSNAFSGILTFTKPVLDDFLSLIKPLSEIALSIAGDILNSIGNALKWRREKFYIATKSMSRDYESMKKDIEISLKNLQTDYIDLYQMHNVKPAEYDTLIDVCFSGCVGLH